MGNKIKYSRRGFLGKTVLGIGAGLVAANPLIADVVDFGQKKHKVGVVGCGNRSKAILGALTQVATIEVSALCDVVTHKMEQRAELIKSGPRPQFFTDYQKLLKLKELDAIVIITPPYLHKEQTIAALDAGKHVFCEKPMALTVADCNEMLKAVERTKKSLQIGTQRRHSSSHKQLVDIIRTRPIGEIRYADLNDYRGDWRVPAVDEYPAGVGYWRLNQSQSGGNVFEMGAHIIDVNNWVFDSEPLVVSSIQGVNNPLLRKRDSMDHGVVAVQYANGALMNYGGNLYNYGPAAPDTFFGEKGTVQFGSGTLSIHYGNPAGSGITGETPTPEKFALAKGDGVVEQLLHFAKVLGGAEKPYPDGYAGRQTVQICEGAVLAAQQKRPVQIKELG